MQLCNGIAVTEMKEAANQFVTAMEFFVEFFPQFKNHTTIVAGESYAGKFVPLYIYYMLEANVHSKVGEYWQIKSAFMGDPYNTHHFLSICSV